MSCIWRVTLSLRAASQVVLSAFESQHDMVPSSRHLEVFLLTLKFSFYPLQFAMKVSASVEMYFVRLEMWGSHLDFKLHEWFASQTLVKAHYNLIKRQEERLQECFLLNSGTNGEKSQVHTETSKPWEEKTLWEQKVGHLGPCAEPLLLSQCSWKLFFSCNISSMKAETLSSSVSSIIDIHIELVDRINVGCFKFPLVQNFCY